MLLIPFTKKAVDVYFPLEATNDFPVAMQVSKNTASYTSPPSAALSIYMISNLAFACT